MAAQKRKKNLLTETFGVFECLQNPTNQDLQLSLFFQTLTKSKNMGLHQIISA